MSRRSLVLFSQAQWFKLKSEYKDEESRLYNDIWYFRIKQSTSLFILYGPGDHSFPCSSLGNTVAFTGVLVNKLLACSVMVCMTLGGAVCAVGGQVTGEDSLSDRFKAKSTEDCVGAHGTPSSCHCGHC